MKAFFVGVSIVPFIWIAYHIAGWYLNTAKHLGANMFRPKDVMGPYVTCIGIAIFLWIALIISVIEIEKIKTDRDKQE